MLKVDKIDVFYGEIQVLWDVSFHVEDSKIISIIGSNGAGKTTTLKTITGLLRPKEGFIKFKEKNIEKLPTHKIVELGISLVPEGRRIFPYLTVYENLRVGAYVKRAEEKLMENIEWIYQLFPRLKERKDQLGGTLSGGERQMLAIARALMSNPILLMMDEPSQGLQPSIVNEIFEIIRKLNEEGITILLVEQNVKKSLELSDYTYVLEGGRIVLEGPSSQLINNDQVKKAYLGL